MVRASTWSVTSAQRWLCSQSSALRKRATRGSLTIRVEVAARLRHPGGQIAPKSTQRSTNPTDTLEAGGGWNPTPHPGGDAGHNARGALDAVLAHLVDRPLL